MPSYTLEMSKLFCRLEPPVVWERDSYSQHKAEFCFDLSRVLCQGATSPLHPRKVETSLQPLSVRVVWRGEGYSPHKGCLAPRVAKKLAPKKCLQNVQGSVTPMQTVLAGKWGSVAVERLRGFVVLNADVMC